MQLNIAEVRIAAHTVFEAYSRKPVPAKDIVFEDRHVTQAVSELVLDTSSDPESYTRIPTPDDIAALSLMKGPVRLDDLPVKGPILSDMSLERMLVEYLTSSYILTLEVS